MSLVFTAFTPHPPILIPEIGKDSVALADSTYSAMETMATRLNNSHPDVLVVITPHGPVFQDALSVAIEPRMQGSFKSFGHPELAYMREGNTELAKKIVEDARLAGISVLAVDEPTSKLYRIKMEMDHGILVPLYFLEKAGCTVPVVSISIGLLPYEELFAFGVALGETLRAWTDNVALLVSGDLSHRLNANSPAGFHEDGLKFDQQLTSSLARGDSRAIYDMQGLFADNAGECGLRPLVIATGILDQFNYSGDILSYEGPFGVGYLVAEIVVNPDSSRPSMVPEIIDIERQRMKSLRSRESVFVKLARESLETYVINGIQLMCPSPLPVLMDSKAGVFVCIKKDGDLRGCIGTIEPSCNNLAEEIIQNSVSAGTRDPRFEPVMQGELDRLVYSVDILNPAEPITSIDFLDPSRYGVIVEKRGRRGLLLPNLAGIETPEQQVAIAKSKAGIESDEPDVKLWRFEVVRYD